MSIPINTWGRILSGNKKGWYLMIQDDSENTGGYLILTVRSLGPDNNEGYDDWAEDMSVVEDYLVESRWLIDWNAK
ncbi:hypothetical protein [Iodidimonas sp. SYSU 1G8]|uniref:hypothetical protein n=1 Tax=Iodidimonas sp. SYSU 1G8 TaxID=3133967 RepID=UPI0031FF2A4F